MLYDGKNSTADFYNDAKDFVNCIAVVCADVNGDGFDEIVTATPTSGYTDGSSDKYGFDKAACNYLWYLNEENRSTESWKRSDGWCSKPHNLGTGMSMSVNNCHLGAPGTTASLAAGDVNGDGYDDLVTAVSTTKAQYNSNYVSNMFSVYYIGGAPSFSEMYLKRRSLLIDMDGETKKELYLGTSSGDASGIGREG